eukprot:5240801-Pyramimonas_sp.AAC.1
MLLVAYCSLMWTARRWGSRKTHWSAHPGRVLRISGVVEIDTPHADRRDQDRQNIGMCNVPEIRRHPSRRSAGSGSKKQWDLPHVRKSVGNPSAQHTEAGS